MEYFRPERLDDALAYLGNGALIAAGCTDLFAATDRPDLTIGKDRPILDITAIKELRGIGIDSDGITIGATTTWSDIIKAALPKSCDALKLAAREVGSVQIQNSATIAGNLCNASPAADGVPPLLILDAEIELQGKGSKRRLPLAQFITGPRQTALEPGEIVARIRLPAHALAGISAFAKLGARKYLVISISMAAMRLVVDGNKITKAAIAVGACSAVATRLPEAEEIVMARQIIDQDLVAAMLSPINDIRADAAYRRQAAGIQLARMLDDLLDRGKDKAA